MSQVETARGRTTALRSEVSAAIGASRSDTCPGPSKSSCGPLMPGAMTVVIAVTMLLDIVGVKEAA